MNAQLTCRDGVAALAEYVDGALSPARRRAIDSHVAVCPRCTAFVRSYGDTSRVIRVATDVGFTDALADSLRRFLAEKL